MFEIFGLRVKKGIQEFVWLFGCCTENSSGCSKVQPFKLAYSSTTSNLFFSWCLLLSHFALFFILIIILSYPFFFGFYFLDLTPWFALLCDHNNPNEVSSSALFGFYSLDGFIYYSFCLFLLAVSISLFLWNISGSKTSSTKRKNPTNDYGFFSAFSLPISTL